MANPFHSIIVITATTHIAHKNYTCYKFITASIVISQFPDSNLYMITVALSTHWFHEMVLFISNAGNEMNYAHSTLTKYIWPG